MQVSAEGGGADGGSGLLRAAAGIGLVSRMACFNSAAYRFS